MVINTVHMYLVKLAWDHSWPMGCDSKWKRTMTRPWSRVTVYPPKESIGIFCSLWLSSPTTTNRSGSQAILPTLMSRISILIQKCYQVILVVSTGFFDMDNFLHSHIDAQVMIAIRGLKLLPNIWRDICMVEREFVGSGSASEGEGRSKARPGNGGNEHSLDHSKRSFSSNIQ